MGATAGIIGTWVASNAGTIGATAAAASAAATTYTVLNQPKAPMLPKSPVMPDQSAILQAQQLEAAKVAAARQGRASTVLTTNADTGDRLGP